MATTELPESPEPNKIEWQWVRRLLDELLVHGRKNRDAHTVENVDLLLLELFDVMPLRGGCLTCGRILPLCGPVCPDL